MDSRAVVALVFPGGADGVGGAEIQALHFLRYCNDEEIDVRLVILGRNPTFERRSLDEGVAPMILNRADRHPWHPAVGREYKAYLREAGVDLVHLYGLKQEVVTRRISQRSGARVVSAIRGMESHRSRLHILLNRVTARWVDLWISNSLETKELFEQRDGLPSAKIDVIPNGVPIPTNDELLSLRLDGRKELEIAPDARVVLCVANHFQEKRIEDLIHAVSEVDAGPEDIHLICVGRSTPYSDVIQTAAATAGERVRLLGYRSDVMRWIAVADVVSLVSEKEGLPSSILEAMAAGLPAVVTPVASLAHLVQDGVTGYHVPLGDIQVIRDRIERLCRDPRLAQSMGNAARAHVSEEYSIPVMVQRILGRYRQLLEVGTS